MKILIYFLAVFGILVLSHFSGYNNFVKSAVEVSSLPWYSNPVPGPGTIIIMFTLFYFKN